MSEIPWRPVTLKSQLTFEGGHQTKAWALETKEVATPNGTCWFVKIDKQADWLTKAVAGNKAARGSLQRTKLIGELKNKLVVAVEEKQDSPEAAVAAGPSEPMIIDPMHALERLTDEAFVSPKKRKSYVSKRDKNNINEVTMPELERTSHPGCERTRQVRLLATSTNSLWIEKNDIDWLVNWIAAEHVTGGVPLQEDPLAGIAPNCAASGVHMRWDFDGAWEAIIIAGSAKGHKTKSYVDKMTSEKWEKVASIHKYAVAYEAASAEDKKQATYHFLEMTMYMQGVMSSNPQLRRGWLAGWLARSKLERARGSRFY